MKSDLLYVIHILDCIARIERYTAAGESSFLAEELIQDAVLRNLQLLAESSQRISQGLKSRFAGVSWRSMAGLRNVLVHDCLGLNLRRIWRIVSVDLPELKSRMESIRRELTSGESSTGLSDTGN